MTLTDAKVREVRALFPVCKRYKYFNHAGVAPTSVAVRDAAMHWIDGLLEYGLTDSFETWEQTAASTRSAAARLIGATPGEIAFVRSTSHGLGLIAEGLQWSPGDEVAVCADVEYPSNVYPWLHLSSRGVNVVPIRALNGGIAPQAVVEAITPRTRLISVSSVQFGTGHATDLAALGELCRERGILFCVDAIQSLGAFPLDVKKCGIHFLSADSHKWLLGLNGIGILFVDESVIPRVRPVIVGWKTTKKRWRFDSARFEISCLADKFEEGSPAYALIAGLGAAIELLQSVGTDEIASRVTSLVDRLDSGLRRVGCEVSPGVFDRKGILTIAAKGVSPGPFVLELRDNGYVVVERAGRIRISPHFYNTEDEVDELVAAFDRRIRK